MLFYRLSELKRGWGWAIILVFLIICASRLSSIILTLSVRHAVAVGEDFGRWVGRLTPVDAVIISGDERDFIAEYGRRRIEYPLGAEGYRIIKNHLEKGTPLYCVLPGENLAMIRRYEEEGYQLVPVGRAPFEFWKATTFLTIINEILYKVENIPAAYFQ